MIALRAFSATLSLCMMALLSGCGASMSSTTTTTTGDASYLAGNWLLAGAMPASYGVTSSALSVTATFDVNGSTVSGIVQIQVPCLTAGAVGTPVVVQGTVAADGSFSLASLLVPGVTSQSFSLKGNLPSAAGGAWTGTYTTTAPGPACAGTNSGTVSATSFPLVNATFSGADSLGNPLNGLAQGVTVKLMLKQGSLATTTQPATNLLLSGTMTVTNSTCITSGTASLVSDEGFAAGAQVGVIFTMNDGSTVLMDGQFLNTSGTALSAILLTTNPGTCGLSFTGAANPILFLEQ
jgi:hypothetical protein